MSEEEYPAMHWRAWARMPRDTDLSEMTDPDVSGEACAVAVRRFGQLVNGRIAWLTDHLSSLPVGERAEAHYVLAELHDRLDIDDRHYIQKRGVRYHAIMVLRLNRSHAAANALLGYSFNWCGLIGKTMLRCPGEGSIPDSRRTLVGFGKATQLMYLRRGIRYLARATQLDPGNPDYARWLSTARYELRVTKSDSRDSCSLGAIP